MRIYCMSDIHGCLEPFLKALETVDMESEDSMLVLLGDYCDRGPDSLGVFRTVMGLQERYGERVSSRLLDRSVCGVVQLRGKDLRTL